MRFHCLFFGAEEGLEGSQGDEPDGFSLISSALCDRKHFLRSAEPQPVLWMQLKLIFVWRIQLSFLHFLTEGKGGINLVLLPTCYLEQDGLKREFLLLNSCWLASVESLYVSF